MKIQWTFNCSFHRDRTARILCVIETEYTLQPIKESQSTSPGVTVTKQIESGKRNQTGFSSISISFESDSVPDPSFKSMDSIDLRTSSLICP